MYSVIHNSDWICYLGDAGKALESETARDDFFFFILDSAIRLILRWEKNETKFKCSYDIKKVSNIDCYIDIWF